MAELLGTVERASDARTFSQRDHTTERRLNRLPIPETLPFVPSDIAPALWVDARALAAADGVVLGAWPASFGPDLDHGSAIYRASGFLGEAAVEFVGGRRLYTTDPAANLGAAFTVVVLLATSPGNADGMAWMTGQEAAGKRRALWVPSQSGGANFSGYNANVTTGINTSSPIIVSLERASNGYVSIFANGGFVGGGSPGLEAYTYEGFALGANVSGSEQYLGRIAELVAMVGSDDEPRQLVEGYIAHRWGLPLADGHPFKTFVP